MRIIYLPLEPLPERYTVQLSAAKTGWLERNWIKHQVPYLRIEGIPLTSVIETGSVLDAHGRGYWALSQIQKVLSLLREKKITTDDVIYFDDFWHPGISALPYCFAQTGVKPRMYAMLHAQSVDCFDFTYSMRHWMRHFEIGIGKILDGIFVTSTGLRDLLLYAGIGAPTTVHLVGLPYNSEEVRSYWPTILPQRKKQVIYVSRWDSEKRPDVFLAIVKEVSRSRPDIKFVISTSFKKIKSNRSSLILELKEGLKTYPNLELRENQTKEQYYQNLLESAVQINTADQDWVSWTLLEATTCGCLPLYPYFLSFPEALSYQNEYLYQKNDVQDAARKIKSLVDGNHQNINWIYERFDSSWHRMLSVMRNEFYTPLYE